MVTRSWELIVDSGVVENCSIVHGRKFQVLGTDSGMRDLAQSSFNLLILLLGNLDAVFGFLEICMLLESGSRALRGV